MRKPSDRGKRVMDLAIAVPALVASLPAQAAIAFVIRRRMGRPVLFRQTRPGRNGVPFDVIKFRTMRPACEGDPVDDGNRLTPLGRFLRSTSLDELPTLWNVVRGDMSMVGPRPLLVEYLDRYTREQARRHEVRPGITGLAQISGRNAIDWETRLALDVEYVDRRSFRLDLCILLRTVAKVARQEGVTNPNHPTMPEFFGTGETDGAGAS